jgi:hypothetical protein
LGSLIKAKTNIFNSILALVNLKFGELKIKWYIYIMEKLVFDYTYCSEPECWEWNIPFEYESKEKFIFDVLKNPMILDELGITSVYTWEIEAGDIYEEEYVKNVDEYVLTLDEWFDKNKSTPKTVTKRIIY